jgi:hypothetical protein
MKIGPQAFGIAIFELIALIGIKVKGLVLPPLLGCPQQLLLDDLKWRSVPVDGLRADFWPCKSPLFRVPTRCIS